MRTTSIGLALWLSACGGEAAIDAGRDAPSLDTPDLDAPSSDVPALDVPALDVPMLDVPAPSDGGTDAPGADAPPVADAGNACEAAGGRCAAVVPGSCMDGIVGDPSRYSCGPGLGVLCCLPRTTAPICDRVGTREEGWYGPDGIRICAVRCEGASVRSEAIGTRSEGWYASTVAAGCMTPPVDRLIQWTDCSP